MRVPWLLFILLCHLEKNSTYESPFSKLFLGAGNSSQNRGSSLFGSLLNTGKIGKFYFYFNVILDNFWNGVTKKQFTLNVINTLVL